MDETYTHGLCVCSEKMDDAREKEIIDDDDAFIPRTIS